jgi:hypothetical protein
VVGVFIGVDSDFTIACERTYERENGLVVCFVTTNDDLCVKIK